MAFVHGWGKNNYPSPLRRLVLGSIRINHKLYIRKKLSAYCTITNGEDLMCLTIRNTTTITPKMPLVPMRSQQRCCSLTPMYLILLHPPEGGDTNSTDLATIAEITTGTNGADPTQPNTKMVPTSYQANNPMLATPNTQNLLTAAATATYLMTKPALIEEKPTNPTVTNAVESTKIH